jgi:hypothetical protein
VVDEKILAKIRTVYRTDHIVPARSGKVYRYPTWFGAYSDAGKQKSVYLGRELPECFKNLTPKRPRFKRSVSGNEPGVDQVSGS